ncbi:tyrosine-type recombinase/integrase [Bradyrhizobium yuanmingense]|uniref:tyrosine-type recombinase/integrase n=1 Tax=Bradyrhizobium yuanmingense TaxID=108015 RepID=UPI0012FCF2C7|nr:site-specific integrase [Bradyrhizobium yuanmingense]MVT55803.1 tyrosine-type recombinase/integrase [Bradyrhizobium yuanmingense]
MRSSSPYDGSLYTRSGGRKYLTPSERARFIERAATWPRPEVGTFCLLLANAGCRISEALSVIASAVERETGYVAVRSLKKRKKIVVREIPLPPELFARIAEVHHAAEPEDRLWPWSRSRAWTLVKDVMKAAGITGGPHATAKGLRHSFGIHAIRSGVPLNLVQRWLGHADIKTTAIYLDVMGEEEREIAARMWSAKQPIKRDTLIEASARSTRTLPMP